MGKVVKVFAGGFHILFPPQFLPKIGSVIFIPVKKVYLIVEALINEQIVACVLLKKDRLEVAINDQAIDTKKPIMVPVGTETTGGVFDVLGNCITKNKTGLRYVPIDSTIEANNRFDDHYELLPTGIKAIDFLCPIIKGTKIGISGGPGVGKTVIIKELINNFSHLSSDQKGKNLHNIFVGVGERTREIKELYDDLKENNLINNFTFFAAQMNEPAGARMKILQTGVTAAEYARSKNNAEVLMFVDNIYRYLQAGLELSNALGKKASEGGYQATLISEISHIQERINSNQNGYITAFQSVFLSMDDLTDPAVVAIFNQLDSILVLARDVAAKGIYPAIDIINTSSTLTVPKIVGAKHAQLLKQVKEIIAKYYELEEILLILGFDELESEQKTIVMKASQLINYFSQNLFTTSQFTGRPGVYVPYSNNIRTIEKIVRGDYLTIHETEFLYISDDTYLDQLLKKQSEQATNTNN